MFISELKTRLLSFGITSKNHERFEHNEQNERFEHYILRGSLAGYLLVTCLLLAGYIMGVMEIQPRYNADNILLYKGGFYQHYTRIISALHRTVYKQVS